MEKKESEMTNFGTKAVSVGQLLISGGGLLGLILVSWINMSVRMATNEQAIKTQKESIEVNKAETNETIKSFNSKMDKVNENLTDLKILIQNKQDRK
jgi:hypothetical protein